MPVSNKNGTYLTTVDGKPIPKVDRIRVLGLIIESNGHNGETIRKLDDVTSQIMRLLKRIANKYSGMKEGNLLRLVQAFVISRIVYVASYLRWHSSERYKLDCLIRKIYKQAIGLSITTSNDSLLQLGLHNTLDELIEAQRIAQYERLSKTKTGRQILDRLGITYHTQHGVKVDMPRHIRGVITVLPIPKNMHPAHHQGRRESRARDIQKKFGHSMDTVFVDAARYRHKRAYTAVVINYEGKCLTSATVSTPHVETAEEIAIALAIAQTQADVIVSDSQTAIRNFANGRISPEALQILKLGNNQEKSVHLIWTPAHTLSEGSNEAAHRMARGLTDRASISAVSGNTDEWEWEDRMTTFHEITVHHRLQRRTFPPPHPKLSKKQSVEWRQFFFFFFWRQYALRHKLNKKKEFSFADKGQERSMQRPVRPAR